MSTAPLPFMMPDMEKATGIVRITSGGIQNLAALIPLLTTVLCEKHVTKALKGGLLYAAVAPMTVFGSLGIAKAGVIALCATIDYRFFHGPALLKNAGFPPRGIGKLFLHVKHNKHHLYKAEDKLRIILSKKKVTEVKVNLWSRDFWWWNICLALSTALMCIIGFLPYIFLIRIFLAERSFHTTWIFPILRLFGSGLVVVNTQFLFQLRLIEETYYRLRFIAADTYLKDIGKTIPTSWDPNERSKKVFSELQLEWLPITDETEETSGYDLKNADKEKILNGVHKLTSFKFGTTVPAPTDDRDTLHRPHNSPVPPIATLDLGPPQTSGEHTTSATTPDTSFLDTLSLPQGDTLTSPTTPGSPSPQGSLHRHSGSEIRKDTAAFNEAEQGAPQSENTPSPRRSDTNSSTGSKFSSAKANKAIIWLTLQFPTLILWGTQAILFFGVVCIIVGYIGCFTVVQLSPGWKGPLLWFLCEVLLSAVRTVIWAANPEWDDARRPIVLEKVQKKDGTTTKSSSYGIAWTLDSPTADDMHALLIGVNNCNTTDFENLEKAKSDAQSVAKYLEETLLVPPSQIRTLYDTDATRIKIVEELKSLRHRGSVTPDAPIIIYYAGHSFVSDNGSTYLVPHLPNGDRLLAGEPEKYCLPYSEIVDLLQHVADEKTDNI
ncbi:hypothetical protein FA13DRAFT_892108 [Coprinellus micaceus]|uniref:Uncharacterized protein n=1 Tax=Coprinellus micaceus TaxID=71717 RepID=A0A4Y7TTL0_COPMI|nr:hypothetical protein FA13DRAFT_892108 [Coprinellus micaceus]